MPTRPSELKVITETKRLAHYIIEVTTRSPKKYRDIYVSKMQNKIINIIELLYYANDQKIDNPKRLDYQNQVITEFKILDMIAGLAVEAQAITMHQLEVMASQINMCTTLLSKWIKSDANRLKITNKTI